MRGSSAEALPDLPARRALQESADVASLDTLAASVGVSREAVRLRELGRAEPSQKHLPRYLQALEILRTEGRVSGHASARAVAGAGRRGDAPAWWTRADAAELDLLVNELVRAAFLHRERCQEYEPRRWCPLLQRALEAVVEWREGRILRSRPAALWAQQDLVEGGVRAAA